MRALQHIVTTAVLMGVGLSPGASAQAARWTEQKANAWYARQPWLVGSNYVPKSAISQLEMWQEATFDPAEIDRELGWAEALDMGYHAGFSPRPPVAAGFRGVPQAPRPLPDPGFTPVASLARRAYGAV